ncbi:pyrroline-5-carboxylate reductase [Ceraceosorus guamensis]|uniref:Pyrroline-5-carboxylate reductase n=1 Tax=Ceraceosorus guamensis TaxID=1522189 RepID=A0A316VNW7_9BASI|nr:pyrroline-5-carboxylate reductase [Ceraceosorus guamensis]PWN39267.1 pyrroline-5-carboxylate reductase [Ceraceosorus guamensis]
MSSSRTSQSPSSVAESAGAGTNAGAGAGGAVGPPPYALGIVGCGTMGIAILSGILASSKAFAAAALLQSQAQQSQAAQSRTDVANEALSESVADLLGEGGGEGGEEEERRRMELKYLPSTFYACVARQESGRRLKSLFANEREGEEGSVQVVVGDNLLAARRSDVVLLACKPHMVADILREQGMQDALKGKLVISICAGLRIQQIAACLHPSSTVVRAMPNTPSKIREGMTVLTPLPPLSSSSSSSSSSHAQSRSRLLSIFNAIGKCRFLDEKHFDAATALAGSGPAFACVFLEAMADGGVMMGLPRKEALELAAQSMQGAARMVLQSGAHPASIKDSVTTPGGCTIAGLLNLEDGKVRSTVARTIQAAAEHAAGLGQVKK